MKVSLYYYFFIIPTFAPFWHCQSFFSLIYNHMLHVGKSPFWVLAPVLPVNHWVTLANISSSVVSSYFFICAMSRFFCLKCKDQPSSRFWFLFALSCQALDAYGMTPIHPFSPLLLTFPFIHHYSSQFYLCLSFQGLQDSLCPQHTSFYFFGRLQVVQRAFQTLGWLT